MKLYGYIKMWLIIIFTLGMSMQCYAWLYDAGSAQHLSVGLNDNSEQKTVWAAALFSIDKDSYATEFGAALSKGAGPLGSGFTMYLAPGPSGLPDSSIASWTISPTDAILKYYYVQTQSPIFLQAGHVYALVFAPNDKDFYGSVSYSGKYGNYDLGTSDYGTSWYALPMPYRLCVRVDGYAVPEPSCFAVIIVGALGLVSLKRCHLS